MIAVDFETEAIIGNPLIHPPKPVGVSVTWSVKDSKYYVGEEMEKICNEIWNTEEELIFHNAPFDLSVARKHFNLPFPNWKRVHDTMYLVFLKNPHAKSLSLKYSADLYLNMPPEEQDKIRDWVLENVKTVTPKNWGAHISKAPYELLAPYAIGDTLRAKKLYDELIHKIPKKPYDRERQLMPFLVDATVKGVRCNVAGLETLQTSCELSQRECDDRIRILLDIPNLNIHSGRELASALDAANMMTEWKLTRTGKRSTARDNLIAGVKDPELLSLLIYSGTIQTILGTFITPWLEKSELEGRLHPNWNQIRSNHGSNTFKGTRTGRLSSDDPNFQNIPNSYDINIPLGLVNIPDMRKFILPEESCVWVKRDWAAQEMRILAHFEEGALYEAFKADPDLDPHTMVQEMIKEKTGKLFDRKFVKGAGFGMIYGMGPKGLSKKLGITLLLARELQDAYKIALPGVSQLQVATKQRGRTGQCITTWGGREYYAEEPKIIESTYRSFEYKLTNYLMQGSAADQDKQCLLDWFEGKTNVEDTYMATVHDEISISVPKDSVSSSMLFLKECMEQDYFDVPMRSDAFTGPSWGELKEYKENENV